MGHDHGREHSHSHHHGGGIRHRRPLLLAFALIGAFFLVQLVTGIVTGSLALLSDAGHMATDALGIGMSLAAIQLAASTAGDRYRTYGLHRLEILAALANSVLLLGVAGYVLIEAARRWSDPPDIASMPVLVVGAIGLGVNIVAMLLLRSGADESLNMRGAYLEVLSDALGSVGVIVAAVVMWITDWGWVDPLVGAAIGLFICPRAIKLGRDALRILVEASPTHIDPHTVDADLRSIAGVVGVHDLHIWTLTSNMNMASAHLVVDPAADGHAVLDGAHLVLSTRHGIGHTTMQLEPAEHGDCNSCSDH